MLLSVFLLGINLIIPQLPFAQMAIASTAVGGRPTCEAYEPPRVPMLSYTLADAAVESTTVYIENPTIMFAGFKLKANAFECNKRVKRGHFEGIHRTLLSSGAYLERHQFQVEGDYSSPSMYTVYVMPNVLRYADLNAVKKDFENCSEAPEFQPIMVTPTSILFERPCTPSDNDKRESGCTVAKAAVTNLQLR